MEYREIVSVTGIGGLFQLVTTKSDGAIVRNITDNSTKFISARKHNVTPLESIEIYTVSDENVRLHEIFIKMQEVEAKTAPASAKGSNDEIKTYFNDIFPEMDMERVYVSDMKKILKWYNLLKDNDLLHFENVEDLEVDTPEAPEKEEEKPAEKEAPAKKATKKKAATKKAAAEGEEKPAKKTATKKKAATKKSADAADKPAKKTAAKKKKED